MSYLENADRVGHSLNFSEALKEHLRHVWDKEVNFRQWFSKLPKEDQANIKRLGDWLLMVIGEQGEVWAVGSTVRNVRHGKDALGNDIDLQVFARCPNKEMIKLLKNALSQDLLSGFQLRMQPRFDQDAELPYFTAEFWPTCGRPIHLLSPKPWEMTPEEERNSRRWPLFNGPFARFEKRLP